MTLNEVTKLIQKKLKEETVDVYFWKINRGKGWDYDFQYPMTRQKVFEMARKAEGAALFILNFDNCPKFTQKIIKSKIKELYSNYVEELKRNKNVGGEMLCKHIDRIETRGF